MNMMMHCKKPSLAVALLSVLVCSNACAGSSGMALGGKHNNKAPIEVTSDSLEVMQEQNKAAFTGHVVAIQGTVRAVWEARDLAPSVAIVNSYKFTQIGNASGTAEVNRATAPKAKWTLR